MRSPRCCWTRRSAMRAVFALGGSALHAAHVVRALYSVSVVNDCGYGVPVLDRIPSDTIATGTGVVFQNTTILDAFAFLNTGNCGPNGGNCTAVEVNLGNPDGSSNAMVDLVPTHVYSVAVSFSFYNACTGAGTSCLTESCVNAARDDSEINGLVSCPAANDPDHSAGLLVTWCPDIPQNYSSSGVSNLPSPAEETSATSAPPSSSTSPASPASHRGRVGPIVGGVVGGVAGLALLALIFVRRARRRNMGTTAETCATPYAVPSSSDAYTHRPEKAPAPAVVLPPSLPPQDEPEPERAEPDLDRIVEGLASRFGWVAPSNGRGDAAETVDTLPAYHGAQ